MALIAAVVATHNRPQLLADRALTSIAGQTRPPNFLVVVDDSEPVHRPTNKGIVASFRTDVTDAIYLENRRTRGASGSWNTALYMLKDVAPSAYVAILDDDDSWAPTYLQRCEEEASDRRLDMVAAAILYHRSPDDDGTPLTPPDRLDVSKLLVESQFVQGSNLFVRLRKLLEAGGFDESLVSTTDRDICISLMDLGSVRYGAFGERLVHHYAETDRLRLSTPGSERKCRGLKQFLHKHSSRMDDGQRAAFIKRARDVFGCDPTST